MNTLISVCTCEDLVKGKKGLTLGADMTSLDLFELCDPFGIRKAVVPVLLMGMDGVMREMGTAFHVDGWGTFLTADHVVHHDTPVYHSDSGMSPEYTPVLLLGTGPVYGTVGLPADAAAHVGDVAIPCFEKDDPLDFQRKHPYDPIDLAILKTRNPIPNEMNRTLPIRLSNKIPKVGDIVVAIGFPDLTCNPIDDERTKYLLTDGMKGAYGRVLDIHHTGRGSCTPVIEVEANWPGGMSGGPVFNSDGEVIGLVSKSIKPTDGLFGNGTAVSFASLPKMCDWISCIDPSNPGWRLGWAVVSDSNYRVIRFFKSEKEAGICADQLGAGYKTARCSNKIGTYEHVLF